MINTKSMLHVACMHVLLKCLILYMQNMSGGVLVSCGKLVLYMYFFPPQVCRHHAGNSFQIVVATDGTQSFAVILFGKVNYIGRPYTYYHNWWFHNTIAPYNDNGMQALNDVTLTWSVYPQLNWFQFSSADTTTCKDNLVAATCDWGGV